MLKPLVTQVWPQFTADEQFTASFSNVFVERVELFRSARKVIICLRSQSRWTLPCAGVFWRHWSRFLPVMS